MQGRSWTILKCMQNYCVRYLGRLWPSVGEASRKPIDLSRFDDIQNSYSEPTVHCYYVVNIRNFFSPFSSSLSPRHIDFQSNIDLLMTTEAFSLIEDAIFWTLGIYKLLERKTINVAGFIAKFMSYVTWSSITFSVLND